MTKSELIEIITAKQKHLPAKDPVVLAGLVSGLHHGFRRMLDDLAATCPRAV